jgi:hypothetical protein
LKAKFNQKTRELDFVLVNNKPKEIRVPVTIKKAIPIKPKKLNYIDYLRELKFTLLLSFFIGLFLGLYMQFKK